MSGPQDEALWPWKTGAADWARRRRKRDVARSHGMKGDLGE
eukprot:CAMPEP_0172624378 /NCGR_PEP_ID=MMETSP1068-20121228/136083_1 /TAXON_ID=35684 /ORGANISM="Pseudopedinella elastica, Strain CCMP716" /LENGTH=40 /DNA_ID= /DNA_START= /DNA_END= /DNA_ORIENTATION=